MSGSELAIGIDFGAKTIKTGLVFKSHVIDQAPAIATKEFGEPAELIDALVKNVEILKARHPGIDGLGVGMPGLVDFHRGWVHNLTHVPSWESVPLGRILHDRTQLPTVVDNRANCMAEAEWRCGAGRGLQDLVFVNIETGVGGAIIAGGRLIRGSRFVAGEIGQTSIDWNGRVGEYGNRGAVECYLGSKAVIEDAHTAFAAAGEEKPDGECTLSALVSAGHEGNPVAMEMWDRLGGILATTLMNACWLLNPQAVVVGGVVTRAGELFFKPLRDRLYSSLSDPFRDHLMVLPASCGPDAGMIGAAALSLEEEQLPV
ncbi:MAG: ROK family protein [Akkermansiaceae bacterium]|nr:ROK family protein [Akkermansiaceae bacterium]